MTGHKRPHKAQRDRHRPLTFEERHEAAALISQDTLRAFLALDDATLEAQLVTALRLLEGVEEGRRWLSEGQVGLHITIAFNEVADSTVRGRLANETRDCGHEWGEITVTSHTEFREEGKGMELPPPDRSDA